MRVYVDQDLCISCGLCIDMSPAVFDWNGEQKSHTVVDEVPSEMEDYTREAMQSCPTDAIKKVEG